MLELHSTSQKQANKYVIAISMSKEALISHKKQLMKTKNGIHTLTT
jgi:hypothetical protein